MFGDTQVLEQIALAEFIRSGAMDRHVRRMRQRYRRRRDALLDLLRARAPGVRARAGSRRVFMSSSTSRPPASARTRS